MPLPTYQESGVFSQPSPRLDLANLKQQEGSSTSMASALDRISEFAFKKAAIKAQREGEQWAYNNPITSDQIKAASDGSLYIATKTKTDPTGAVIPEAGTVFADAARKGQAGQLRSELELSARSAVANIAREVEAGNIKDLKQLNDLFFGIQEGYGKILGKIDPEQANALRASIATISNPTFIAAAKKIGEINVRELEEKTNATTAASDSIIRSHIVNETDPVKLNELIGIERKAILDSAAQTMKPEFVAAKIKELDTIQQNAYIDVLSKYIVSSEFTTDTKAINTGAKLDAILSGNVGKYKNIWATLPSEARDKITDQSMKIIAKKEQLKEADIKETETQNKAFAMIARNNFYKLENKTPAVIDAHINTLIGLNDITAAEIKALRSGEETKSNSEFLYNIDKRINQGKISEQEIAGYLKEKRINYQEASKFQNDIQNQSKEMGTAKELIRTALRIPDGLIIGPEYKLQQDKQTAMVQTLLQRQDAARAEGKLFDPVTEAKKLIGQTVTEISEDRRRKAEEELKQAYIDANIKQPKLGTYTTKEALEKVKPDITKFERQRILDAEAELRKLR